MKLHKKFLRQAGLSLMEVILSVTITSASLVGVNALVSNYTTENKNTLVADQMRRTADAYTAYIKDNYSAILAIAKEDVPYQISINDLVTKGYLPTQSAATNAYEQNLCALVRNVDGALQGLVITESGEEIKKADLGSIASQVGSRAGAVLDTDENGNVSTVITGVKKSWSLPISAFHNLSNNSPSHANASVRCDGSPGKVQVTPGHLAVVLWFENTFTQASTIYRDSVPGAPQLNRMNTPLVMNAPQTVGAACTTTGAIANDGTGTVVYCTGGIWRRPANNMWWGDSVPGLDSLPTCTPQLNGNVRVLWGAFLPATHPSLYTCNGSSWAAVGIDNQGNLNVPGSIGAGTLHLKSIVGEDAACAAAQVGVLARSATGEVLACQKRNISPNTPGGVYYWTRTNSSMQCQTLPKGYNLNQFSSASSLMCADVEDPVGGPPGLASNQWWLVTSQSHAFNHNPYIHQTAKDFFANKTWTRHYQQHLGTWSAWKDSSTPSRNNIAFNHCKVDDIRHVLCSLQLDSNSQWVVQVNAKGFMYYETGTALWVDGARLSETRGSDTDSHVSFSHHGVMSKTCGIGPCVTTARLQYGNDTYGTMNDAVISMMAFRVD